MTTLTKTQSHEAAAHEATEILPIAGAVIAGVFLIFFAGFAQATVFHDSAHDTRHTLAFPCH